LSRHQVWLAHLIRSILKCLPRRFRSEGLFVI
jgi:hypothetical protein